MTAFPPDTLSSRSGWRARVVALGHARALLLITLASMLGSELLTGVIMTVLAVPLRPFLEGLLIGTVVPLCIAPLAAHFVLMMMFESESLRRQLAAAALRDWLTGTFNRGYFMARLQAAIVTAGRESQPLALLMVDVDNFKRINDQYGHLVGDRVLVALCEALGDELAADQLLARFGGEEFVILLPATRASAASRIAERLRLRVAGACLEAQGPARGGVTVSIGVSVLGVDEQDGGALIARADQALYAAKRAGRNCWQAQWPVRPSGGEGPEVRTGADATEQRCGEGASALAQALIGEGTIAGTGGIAR